MDIRFVQGVAEVSLLLFFISFLFLKNDIKLQYLCHIFNTLSSWLNILKL